MKKIISGALVLMLTIVGITPVIAAPTATLPDNTAEISCAAGEFEVEFDSAVDDDTIKNITLVDENGKTVKGGIYPEVSPDQQTVTIKYGVLEGATDYTLTVGSQSKVYTTEDDTFFFEDFSNENLANATGVIDGDKNIYTSGNNSVIHYEVGTEDELEDIVSIDSTQNGDKYIRLKSNPEVKKNTKLKLEFPDAITDEFVVATVKIKVGAIEGATRYWTREFMTTQLNGLSEFKIGEFDRYPANNALRMQGTVTAFSETGGKIATSGTFFSNDTVDEDGFSSFTVVYKRDASNKYNIFMSNRNKLTDGYFYAKTSSSSTGIDMIQPILISTYSGAVGQESYADISEISIKKGYDTDLLYTDVAQIDRENGKFKIVFTNDVDSESASMISLKNSEGEEVEFTYMGLSDDKRCATYEVNRFLEDSEDYTIDLSKVIDLQSAGILTSEYNFTSKKTMFGEVTEETVKNGENVITGTSLGDVANVTLTMKAKNTGENPADFILAAVVYNAEGRIEKTYVDKSQTNISAGSFANMELTTQGELKAGWKVKRFVWRADSIDNTGAVAIAEPLLLSK